MGFLSKFGFGVRAGDEEQLKTLEQGIGLLRLSSFYCLQKRYTPRLGLEKAATLAVAVVSKMILEPAGDERLGRFCEKHGTEIAAEALKIRTYEEMSGPSGCASYLFAAEMLHSRMVKGSDLTDATRKWKSSLELQEQAAHLAIEVPTSIDICGSNDKGKMIASILSFAKAFYYTNTWTGPSPAIPEVSLPSIPFDYDFLTKVLLDRDDAEPEMPVQPDLEKEAEDVEEVPPAYSMRAHR